jgi:predicted TIM-barrel fold metal-dependent hydrolase
MRIDAHHHFWKLGRYDYPWLGPQLSAIYCDFGPSDLEPLLARHRIDRTVLVQTISSLDETKWFLSLARQRPFIAGVVRVFKLSCFPFTRSSRKKIPVFFRNRRLWVAKTSSEANPLKF